MFLTFLRIGAPLPANCHDGYMFDHQNRFEGVAASELADFDCGERESNDHLGRLHNN
jgi:hypothetical protein